MRVANSNSFSFRFGILYFAKSIPMLIQFTITWYFSLQLTLIDYGIYQSCWLFVAVLSIIGNLGLTTLLQNKNFTALILSQKKIKKIVLSAIIIAHTIAAIYLYYSNIYLPFNTLLLLFVYIIGQSFTQVFETINIAEENNIEVLVINILYAIVFGILHYINIKSDYNLHNLLISITILLFIKLLAYFVVYKKKYVATSFEVSNAQFYSDWIFLGSNEMLSVFAKWIDKIVIFFLVSSTEFAYYFNGSYEIPFFLLFVAVAGNLLIVSFSKKAINNNEIKKQFSDATSIISSIIFPAFVFLLFYHSEIFQLFFKSKFNDSIPVFVISLLIIPVRITHYTSVLQVKNKSKIILMGSIIDIIAFAGFCVILYPLGGKLMIPLSLVLSTYLLAWYYLYQTSLILKAPIQSFFPLISLLWKMLFCFVVIGASYFLQFSITPLIKLLIGFLIAVIVISFLLLKDYHKQNTITKVF